MKLTPGEIQLFFYPVYNLAVKLPPAGSFEA